MKKKTQVDTPGSGYLSMQADLELVDALMGGTRAMREAGEKYLPREPKESLKAYQNRLSRSVLYNAFEDTVNKLVGKPFSKPVTVKDKTPEDIKQWAEDIDRCGCNLTTFARHVLEAGLTDGLTHILVDYPTAPAKRSIADEKEAGIRPYAIHIKAKDLIAWQYQTINGIKQLTQIRIREDAVEPDGIWGEKTLQRIRVIYPDKYELYERKSKEQWVQTQTGPVSLGRIPLVTFYTKRTGFMMASPPLLSLAYLNVQHWQSSSDQEHILHFIRFPLLHGAGFSADKKDMDIGPNRMIISDDPQARLTYVEHSGAAVEAGRTAIQDIEDRMNVAGMQLLIRKPGNPTATAATIDNASTENPLQTMVRLLENSFSEMFGFMAAWVGRRDTENGGISINQDFGISLRDSRDIDTLLKARLAGEISRETFLAEMKRRGLLQDDLDIKVEMERIEMVEKNFMLEENINETVTLSA